MDFKEELRNRTSWAEAVLKKYLPEVTGPQSRVIEAMNYSFLAGGKRLRPILMNETFRLFGGKSEIVEPFMAAIEMIHTYSLIHDDLPAMDDDDTRRGRPTVHVAYDEATAVLAGDGLLNFAFETALRAAEEEPGNPDVTEALWILAHNSGIYGMLGGQAVDVEYEGKPIDRETLDFIYDKKTGALIEAAMCIGAVLAGAGDDERRVIAQAARDVGLAFQIRDDILDVCADPDEFGKPVGSDEKNEKTTYVTLRGLEQASEDVGIISRRAVEALDSLLVRSEFLNELIEYLITRNH